MTSNSGFAPYLISLALLLFGCAAVEIDSAASAHSKAAQSVQLGDSKAQVLALLLPTQANVPAKYTKEPDRFMTHGKKTEIYYMRSSRQPDGLTTDDEFTPYVFRDDVLVGVGWAALGGPKTQGQVVQPAPVTNIKIEQNVDHY